ncbi:MAG TPA: hypothetical protein VKE96_03945 [Vicinamibacterales bacterium]|nr:hypothetical protein [Vicinamibacterales bacterium]
MTTEDNASALRISNWTLATGTKAGARHVYPATPMPEQKHSEPVARS